MNIGILFYALGWKIIKIFTDLKNECGHSFGRVGLWQAPTDPPRSCNLKQHFWTASTHSIVATALGLLRYALIVVTRFSPVVQLEQ
jgi:hypothetical protein